MQHQGVRHFTTLRYDLEAARHPRGSVDETTSETPRAMRPSSSAWVSPPPSSLAHHREFQVVDNISVYPNVLLGTLSDLMMCEGGRRVIARGHDADVVGPVCLFLHIVPPDGKLLSSLARHRYRHVVGVNAALLVCRM